MQIREALDSPALVHTADRKPVIRATPARLRRISVKHNVNAPSMKRRFVRYRNHRIARINEIRRNRIRDKSTQRRIESAVERRGS